MDCSPLGYPAHGISQARILERVTISFSRASSQPSDQNPHLLHWQVDSLPLSHQESPHLELIYALIMMLSISQTFVCIHSPPELCEPCTVIIPILLMRYSEMKLFVSQLHSYLKGTLGCEAVSAGSGAVLSIGVCATSSLLPPYQGPMSMTASLQSWPCNLLEKERSWIKDLASNSIVATG